MLGGRANGLSAAALWVGAALLMGLVALFAYAPIFAVDFFWQLKLGEIIAKTGAIPTTDLFSAVHPDRPYVQFQWLWELLAYGAYGLGGLRGVRLFQVATMTVSFAVLGGVMARLLRGQRELTLAFCALALVLFEDRFQVRPSATVLGFSAAMLPLWLGSTRASFRMQCLWAFALTCVWSNIHGGECLLSVVCLGARAVGDALAARLFPGPDAPAPKRALVLWLCACLGALASPTFVAGLSDWTWAIGPQLESGNKEWRPTLSMLENGFTPSFVLIALLPSGVTIAYVVAEWRSRRTRARPPLAEWLLCAGLLALSQQAVRNAFLCLVPLAFLLQRARAQELPRRTRGLLIGASFCLLLVAFDDHVMAGYGGVAEAAELLPLDLAPSAFPEELADFMQEARIEGGVMNDGRWGGYLIFRRWPQNHVFVDSRHDLTAVMWPIFLDAHAPALRPRALREAFQRWGIGLAAFRGPTFPAVTAPPEWQLLYKAGDQELYQHVRAQNAETNIRRARDFLRARAEAPEAELAQLAIEVGSKAFLSAPYQKLRAEKARRLLSGSSASDAAEGLRIMAGLWFDAGLYDVALPALRTLIDQGAADVQTLYRAVLCAAALENRPLVRRFLVLLAQKKDELSPLQRGRLSVVERTAREPR